MSPLETARILAWAAAFDRRTIGEADVLAWCEALDGVSVDDALAAVTEHYRSSTGWLMPAHVRRHAEHLDHERRRLERENFERAALAAEAGDPTRRDRSPEVQALLDHLREQLGPGRPEALRRPEWLENDRRVARAGRAEANPAYAGPPPLGGWPLPDDEAPGPERIERVREEAP